MHNYMRMYWGKKLLEWSERPVYGKIRSMTASGLRRKKGLDAYLKKWNTGASLLFCSVAIW